MERLVLRRGFTVVDLVVLVISGALIVGVIALVLPSMGRTHCGNPQLKDSTQVRGIHQAMVVWAQNNRDQYPLPSVIDANNDTVAEIGTAKDTTNNILSMLIYNGSIGTEMLISPGEASGQIQLYDTYEFEKPSGALNPEKAMWDPKLRADFTAKEPAHNSYAHLLPSGARLGQWNNNFNQDVVILGNRGPRVTAVTYDGKGVAKPALDEQSVTMLIHGSRVKWEGNVAFNDNHVEFLSSVAAGKYKTAAGAERQDVLFYDEPDDAGGTNAFLGIYIGAGGSPPEFKTIWD
jgi:hypothetical protein